MKKRVKNVRTMIPVGKRMSGATLARVRKLRDRKSFTPKGIERQLDIVIQRFPHRYKKNEPPPLKALNFVSRFLFDMHTYRLGFSLKQRKKLLKVILGVQKKIIEEPQKDSRDSYYLEEKTKDYLTRFSSKDLSEIESLLGPIMELMKEERAHGEAGKLGLRYKDERETANLSEKIHLLKHATFQLSKHIIIAFRAIDFFRSSK